MQLFSKFVINQKVNGSIVNLASIVGQIGFDELSGYAASKGALIALTKSFSSEMSRYGIRANTISPGFTKTSYYENFKKNKKKIIQLDTIAYSSKKMGNPRRNIRNHSIYVVKQIKLYSRRKY